MHMGPQVTQSRQSLISKLPGRAKKALFHLPISSLRLSAAIATALTQDKKAQGEQAVMSCYGTLRQRCSRKVRRTCFFQAASQGEYSGISFLIAIAGKTLSESTANLVS